MKKKLYEIAGIQTGYIKRDNNKPSESIILPIITLKNLSVNGAIKYDEIGKETVDTTDRYPQLKKGDVVFAAKGIRRTAGVVDRYIEGLTASNHLLIIELNQEYTDKILPEFLAFYLRQKPALDYFKLNETGSHIPFISAAVLKEIEIDIPEVKKQKKLVEIEGLMSREEELTEELFKLKAKYNRGVLTELLKGEIQ